MDLTQDPTKLNPAQQEARSNEMQADAKHMLLGMIEKVPGMGQTLIAKQGEPAFQAGMKRSIQREENEIPSMVGSIEKLTGQKMDPKKLSAYFEELGGHMISATYDPEVQAAARKSLEHPEAHEPLKPSPTPPSNLQNSLNKGGIA